MKVKKVGKLLIMMICLSMIMGGSNLTTVVRAEESDSIVKKGVVDPANTTVNMFDYWITDQNSNDYEADLSFQDILNGKINKAHLFLFAGYYSSSKKQRNPSYPGEWVPPVGDYFNNPDVVGAWNSWTGATGNVTSGLDGGYWKPYTGIVSRTLDGGYPTLDLNNINVEDTTKNNFPFAYQGEISNTQYTEESLDYLFDSSIQEGKKSYPNVTGLFQFKDGYYFYNSKQNFAELNADQELLVPGSVKNNNESGNKITLYNNPWESGNDGGQFFPFNDKTTLSKNSISDQATTNYPINHYFGMTMETEFQQPVGGVVKQENQEEVPMTFEFSGDDDVWIYVDNVLVGDIGGIHKAVRITIDFETGVIKYYGQLTDEEGTLFHTTSIKEMFEDAGDDVVEKTKWSSNGNTFADKSIHTLKFFYLERGNDVSNCSLKFNLQEPEPNLEIVKTQTKTTKAEATTEELPVEAGDTVTYYLTVTNTGGKKLTDVTITDAVPDGLEFVKANDAGKAVTENGKTTITWDIGELDVEGSKTVSFEVKVPQADKTTQWKNIGYVTTPDIPTPDPENPEDPNIPSNEVVIEEKVPNLEIVKTQTKTTKAEATTEELPVEAGDTVTYYLTVTNTGTGVAEDVIVSDVIPNGLVLLQGSISHGGKLTANGQMIVWKLGNIQPGGSIELSFTVVVPKVSEETIWQNIAIVSFSNDPENPSNPGNPLDPNDPHGGRTPHESNEVEIVELEADPLGDQNSNDPTNGFTSEIDDTVNSGDDTQIQLWINTAMASMAGIALILAIKKRKELLEN